MQDNLEILNYQLAQSEEFRNRIVILERDLNEETKKKILLEQSVIEQINTVSLNCKAEIDLYKEETAQHAITIDLLNDRLQKLNKEMIDLKNELTQAKAEKPSKTYFDCISWLS